MNDYSVQNDLYDYTTSVTTVCADNFKHCNRPFISAADCTWLLEIQKIFEVFLHHFWIQWKLVKILIIIIFFYKILYINSRTALAVNGLKWITRVHSWTTPPRRTRLTNALFANSCSIVWSPSNASHFLPTILSLLHST